MKKDIQSFILFILFQTIVCFSFAQTGRYVFGKNYEGYSFPKEHEIWGFPPAPDRYTLSDKEIEEAEIILKKNIKKFNQVFIYHDKKILIRYRLKKYNRQYYGYVNDKGERIVVIFLWLKKHCTIKELSDDILMSLGGSLLEGAFNVNLETKELIRSYDLSKKVV